VAAIRRTPFANWNRKWLSSGARSRSCRKHRNNPQTVESAQLQQLVVVVGRVALPHLVIVEEVPVPRRLLLIAEVARVVPVGLAALVVGWPSVGSSLALGAGISGNARSRVLARIVSRDVALIHAGMGIHASSVSEASVVVLGFSQSSVFSHPVVAISAHRLVANVANRSAVVKVRDHLNHLDPVQGMSVVMNAPDLNVVPRLNDIGLPRTRSLTGYGL